MMNENTPPPNMDLDFHGLGRRRQDAIETWFNTFADPVYSFVFYRVGRSEGLAADVAQETFVTALAKIEKYDANRGSMLPWLTYIARNCIRKTLRERARNSTMTEVWDEVDRRLPAAFATLAAAPLPDEVFERKETGELVRMALSNLPLRYQRALENRYFKHRSLKRIASDEGLTEGAVKSLLHRARAAFRASFETIAETVGDQRSAERGLL